MLLGVLAGAEGRPSPPPTLPGMSAASKAVLAASVAVSGVIVAAVHLQQSRVRERLREGVLRDVERQNRKQENLRLLEQQIALTEQLEMERSKMLMGKESSQ
ncbi:protein PET117 homolog, mitochondrial [Zootoca vivipara]|uniref:protein PET117 homolog, mitochondrial n=1 Tax=Zootoca vivipara TaxID=8524 RepID=UPI00293B9FC8|nr:protein PET117 homolog, mitochondrial [Zootoca vivipara]